MPVYINCIDQSDAINPLFRETHYIAVQKQIFSNTEVYFISPYSPRPYVDKQKLLSRAGRCGLSLSLAHMPDCLAAPDCSEKIIPEIYDHMK